MYRRALIQQVGEEICRRRRWAMREGGREGGGGGRRRKGGRGRRSGDGSQLLVNSDLGLRVCALGGLAASERARMLVVAFSVIVFQDYKLPTMLGREREARTSQESLCSCAVATG
jgi:hypothetical protein